MGKHEVAGVSARGAVFIDRDGTIIDRIDVLTESAQVVLLPGAAEGIAELNRRGFLAIGITNQPIIEKGLLTLDELDAIHVHLQKLLAAAGAHLDGIYSCPHKYRPLGDSIPQCECRKPGIKLIQDAEKDFVINMERSWFVGDRLRDVQTGVNAKLKTILVPTGGLSNDDEFFPDVKPDFFADNLKEAAQFILKT
jgi:mannose-1-phosphate guanylyltransferase / phosphomannomutase